MGWWEVFGCGWEDIDVFAWQGTKNSTFHYNLCCFFILARKRKVCCVERTSSKKKKKKKQKRFSCSLPHFLVPLLLCFVSFPRTCTPQHGLGAGEEAAPGTPCAGV